jgi:ABC transporter, CydDC cysteine exporter (CydDC-E) family, permease/ATP-binding protein CydD
MMDKRLPNYDGALPLIVSISILTLIQALSTICQAIYLAQAIVRLYEGAALNAVLSSFSLFLTAFFIRQLVQWLKSKRAYHFAEKTAAEFRRRLIEKMFELGPREVGKYGSGSFITLCLEGIPSFRTYLELFLPRFLQVLVIPGSIFLFLLFYDTASAVILLAVLPIVVAFLILLGLIAQREKDKKWESYQLLARHFVDSLQGIATLKFLGMGKSHKESIFSVSEKHRKATIRTLRIAFLSSFSLDFFSTLSVAVVAVELGLRLINGTIGFEPALAILILTPEYFLPIRELGNDYHATLDGREAGERIHDLLETEGMNRTERNREISGKRMSLSVADGSGRKRGPIAEENILPLQSDPVVLENYGWDEHSVLQLEQIGKYSREEERLLLRNVGFQVMGFQKVGIVGKSGAGKTTLIDILAGFSRPDRGEFVINGHVRKDLCFSAWRNQVSYIPQHPYIFSGTVAENIALYNPDAPRSEIERVAEITGLTKILRTLPKGLDEEIGQGGRNLSGGEEQRIALARALLDRRPILLFDEPTAHLDIETEQEIKQMMLPLFENKLIFFATHRLHWMREMDMVIVLEAGQLAEMGPPSVLLERKGVFYRLVMSQKGMERW